MLRRDSQSGRLAAANVVDPLDQARGGYFRLQGNRENLSHSRLPRRMPVGTSAENKVRRRAYAFWSAPNASRRARTTQTIGPADASSTMAMGNYKKLGGD
jgi:hypothetical protein